MSKALQITQSGLQKIRETAERLGENKDKGVEALVLMLCDDLEVARKALKTIEAGVTHPARLRAIRAGLPEDMRGDW